MYVVVRSFTSRCNCKLNSNLVRFRKTNDPFLAIFFNKMHGDCPCIVRLYPKLINMPIYCSGSQHYVTELLMRFSRNFVKSDGQTCGYVTMLQWVVPCRSNEHYTDVHKMHKTVLFLLISEVCKKWPKRRGK